MKDYAAGRTALELASRCIPVYPLAPGSKAGLKGGHAFKDATMDADTIRRLFGSEPAANVGILLAPSGLLVVDVDCHTPERDGRASLTKLAKQGRVMPSDTYIEKSPNGLHYFFRADTTGLSNNREAFFKDSGIEVRVDHVSVAPSELPSGAYQPINQWGDVQPAPDWVLEQLHPPRKPNFGSVRPVKKYTGKLLDMVVSGAGEGNRNDWLTSIIGRLFAVGMEPENAYQLALVVNEHFITPPLDDSEVITIYNSILRKEVRRIGGNSNGN